MSGGALPNFIESLNYTATDVFLQTTAALGGGTALPGNPQRVANALNGYFNAGGVLPSNFMKVFGLTGELSLAMAAQPTLGRNGDRRAADGVQGDKPVLQRDARTVGGWN